jgi:paraquat-inducible protein A
VAAFPVLHDERECPDCGLFQKVPPLAPGMVARCPRCGARLRSGTPNSMLRSLACSVAALLLFILALQLPLFRIEAVGRATRATVFTGPAQLDRHGMWELTLIVLATLVVMPAAKLGLMLTVLIGLRLPRPPRILPHLFGLVERVGPWAMVEVFLVGSFVAYTRLQAIATVDVGPALIALGVMMLCMVAADAELDHETVWETMERRGLLPAPVPRPAGGQRIGCDCCHLVLQAEPGQRCPRCGRRLRRRKPASLIRTSAFLIAAAVLYVPANLFPVMTVIRFGRGAPNTIMSGVLELIDDQMYPLALIVFLASLVVPLLKICGLTVMVAMTYRGSAARLRDRTRLYRLIDGVGRWSMIDVFMLTVLVALVRMGFIASIRPGTGAIAFALVVVLTMAASRAFDPRLMWDAAGRNPAR